MTKHRMYNSKEYQAWARIKTRCYNKNDNSFKTYGARGIRMDPRWKDSFMEFYRDMGAMPKGCTGLELINMDADFCKHNCQWVNAVSRRPLKDMPNQKKRERQK